MSIDDVAQELYALVPEEFTAARNARAKEAKAAGDAELAAQVQALRKPTAGAWLLNQLVRRQADEVQQVLDLGAQLRAAQGNLGAAEVRALDQQRRQLTRAVAQQARALGQDAGRRVTDQVTTDVEETLRSAMVDEAAGAALLTGLLTDTFSSTGLEPVDLSRVVAVPGSATGATTTRPVATASEEVEEPDPDHERRVAEAEEAVAGAQADLEAAVEAADGPAPWPRRPARSGVARGRARRGQAPSCARSRSGSPRRPSRRTPRPAPARRRTSSGSRRPRPPSGRSAGSTGCASTTDRGSPRQPDRSRP